MGDHLQGCSNFDAVNTMDPQCRETWMIDAFICRVLEGVFVGSTGSLQPLHFAASLVNQQPATDAGTKIDMLETVRSFYGRALIVLIQDAITELGSRARGLSRIVKRALKHAFAGDVVKGSRLVGLCDGFRVLCENIDTLIVAAISSADLSKAAATENHDGVPLAHPPGTWGIIRSSALGVLAGRCATATPSRPLPRSDTIPYNSANHFKLVLDMVGDSF